MTLKMRPSRFVAAPDAAEFNDTLARTTLRASEPAQTAHAPQTRGRPAPQTVRMTGMSRAGF